MENLKKKLGFKHINEKNRTKQKNLMKNRVFVKCFMNFTF